VTSRRIVKTLHRDVLAVAPTPTTSIHLKWMTTPISFGSVDFLSNMVGIVVLPLLVTPTISNVMMCHMLIDGAAAINVMSTHAFKALQIPMSKLTHSPAFGGVGKDPV
jgi:hypothetical protein